MCLNQADKLSATSLPTFFSEAEEALAPVVSNPSFSLFITETWASGWEGIRQRIWVKKE